MALPPSITDISALGNDSLPSAVEVKSGFQDNRPAHARSGSLSKAPKSLDQPFSILECGFRCFVKDLNGNFAVVWQEFMRRAILDSTQRSRKLWQQSQSQHHKWAKTGLVAAALPINT